MSSPLLFVSIVSQVAPVTRTVGLGDADATYELRSNMQISIWWWLAIAVAAITTVVLLEISGMTRRGGSPTVSSNLKSSRRIWLLVLRCGIILLLLWMLGGWELDRYEVDRPDLLMLVDDSRSMTLPVEGNASDSVTPSRWQSAVDLLSSNDGRWIQRFEDRYRLRLFTVGESLNRLPIDLEQRFDALKQQEPTGEASRLGEALIRSIENQRGRSTSAIVLISDGVVTEGADLEEAAQHAAAARLPIIVVRTGNVDPPPSVELVELVAESTAMVGDRVQVMARFSWVASNGQPIRVRLKDQSSGRTLAEKEIGAGIENGSGTVSLLFTATETGLRRLRVEAEPFQSELVVDDNFGDTSVDVRDESFKVLLVQGSPSYEFRFLKHLLERATSRDGSRPLVELTSVLQSGDPRYADQDRAASRLPPVDQQTLEQLDLMILSDCDPEGLGRLLQSRTVELVTKNGMSLLVIAGPRNLPGKLEGTPLESILPIDPATVGSPSDASQPLDWNITSLGRSLPSLTILEQANGEINRAGWEIAPPIYWLATGGRLRAGARVLLEAVPLSPSQTRQPILVSQLAGNGQVWLQLTDESFRLHAATYDGQLYERYWLQMIRALAQRRQVTGDQDARLDVVGQRFAQGASIPFEVQLGSQLAAAAGTEVEISVSGDDSAVSTHTGRMVATGRGGFRGLISGLPSGSYRAVLTRPTGASDPASDTFVVDQQSQEFMRVTSDAESLANLAAKTGGHVIDISQAQRSLEGLIPEGREVKIKSLEPLVIWNHWIVCAILFALVCSQWVLRRRFGSL